MATRLERGLAHTTLQEFFVLVRALKEHSALPSFAVAIGKLAGKNTVIHY